MALGASLLLGSCIDTGQAPATVPLRAAGTAVTEPISSKNDWTVELTRADVAFGPLYLCAGTQAGALCDTARLEWLESVVIDALDAESHAAGELEGVTGPVRSWMADLGITSLLTQQDPLVLAAAQELGGRSLVLEGVARKMPHTIGFRVEIPIEQEKDGEIGVSVLRKSGSEAFEHDVTGEEEALTVRFDPKPWARAIDFDAVVRDLDCADDGCTIELTFSRGDPVGQAVRTAVLSGGKPAFEWNLAQ